MPPWHNSKATFLLNFSTITTGSTSTCDRTAIRRLIGWVLSGSQLQSITASKKMVIAVVFMSWRWAFNPQINCLNTKNNAIFFFLTWQPSFYHLKSALLFLLCISITKQMAEDVVGAFLLVPQNINIPISQKDLGLYLALSATDFVHWCLCNSYFAFDAHWNFPSADARS